MIHWSRILDNRWLLSNNFCKTFFQVLSVIARLSCVEGSPGLTQNFSKLKKDMTELNSVHDSIFIFFHAVHWSLILGQGWLLSNHFCKECQKCLHPSFAMAHKAVRTHHCCFVVKVPRNAIKQHKPYAYLSKTNLTCFTKIIAVQPSMAKYEWTMYQIKED